MKCEITKEIFIALRNAIPLEHFAFSSPAPTHGFPDRREHFKGANKIYADIIYDGDRIKYWLFVDSKVEDGK